MRAANRTGLTVDWQGVAGRLPGKPEIITTGSFLVVDLEVISLPGNERDGAGGIYRRTAAGAASAVPGPGARVSPRIFPSDAHGIARIAVRAEEQLAGIIRGDVKNVITGNRRNEVPGQTRAEIIEDVDGGFGR